MHLGRPKRLYMPRRIYAYVFRLRSFMHRSRFRGASHVRDNFQLPGWSNLERDDMYN